MCGLAGSQRREQAFSSSFNYIDECRPESCQVLSGIGDKKFETARRRGLTSVANVAPSSFDMPGRPRTASRGHDRRVTRAHVTPLPATADGDRSLLDACPRSPSLAATQATKGNPRDHAAGPGGYRVGDLRDPRRNMRAERSCRDIPVDPRGRQGSRTLPQKRRAASSPTAVFCRRSKPTGKNRRRHVDPDAVQTTCE